MSKEMIYKRMLAIAIGFTMTVSAMPFYAFADDVLEEESVNELEQTMVVEENKDVAADRTASDVIEEVKLGDNVKGVLTSDGTLTVSGSGNMYDFGNPPHSDIPFEKQASKITKLVINNGVTSIGSMAFRGCSNITGTVEIPSSVKVIGEDSFSNCGMNKLVLSNGLTTIKKIAFGYCQNLTSITLPASVSTLEENIFDGCENIASYNVDSSNKYFKSVDGVLFSKDGTNLFEYPAAKSGSEYTVPAGVTKITSMGINDNLTRINLPAGLKEIGDGAFCWDRNLSRVDIPDTVTTIGSNAFYNCLSISSITIPSSVTTVGTDAFLYCKKLYSLIIKSKTCSIKRASVPKSTMVKGYIDSQAFTDATALGLKFVDIETDKVISDKTGNQAMVDLMPTEGITAEVPMQAALGYSTDSNGQICSYAYMENQEFKNLSSKIKQEMKDKTASLKGDNDYQTAKNIFNYIKNDMKYVSNFISLEGAWTQGVGNCMTYANLTASMLYYANIPCAYVFTPSHVINLALCDGKWVDIDSQGYFDKGMNSYNYGDIKAIEFYANKCTYVIDDMTGPKLTGVGTSESYVDMNLVNSGITLPKWATGYFTRWYKNHSEFEKMTIRGYVGTAAEKMVKELGFYITYNGDMFTATKNNPNAVVKPAVKKPAKPTLKLKKGKKKFSVKTNKVFGAKWIQIQYTNNKGTTCTKTYSNNTTKYRTIKKLKKGTYKVRARSVKQANGENVYSDWTGYKKVKVK